MASAFLGRDYFQRDVLDVARDLVGVELVWNGCSGIILETEAYAVEGDPACHTATRPSAREFVKTQPPGAAYVYFNYGMYWLFNLHVKGGDRDGLILIRALEPRRGLATMQSRRHKTHPRDLCSGPGKLAVALGIDGTHHGATIAGSGRRSRCGLRRPSNTMSYTVVADVRVGIRQAANFPWRFLAKDHPCLSVHLGKVKTPM